MKLESGRVVLSSLLLLSLSFSFLCITSISSGSTSTVSKDLLFGVAPQDEEYYSRGWSSKGTLKCKDGSRHFTKSQLNDDFCDCPDGSDEPGTSACPNGKFYCKNSGHIPLKIYSSRVNDGICDCCDGSDEYDGKIKCPNTCWEAGKVARDKLKKKIATYQEGVTIRNQEVEQAKLAIAKEEAELSKLKDEEKILKGLVEQLKGRKEQIERAEEKERLQKEKEEKERKETEEAKLKENRAEYKADVPEGEPVNNVNDKSVPSDDSPSIQDAAEDHGNSVTDSEHTDETTKGPLGDGVEQVKAEDGVEHVKENSPQHPAEQEEGTQGDDKAGLDTKKEEKAATENTESLSREELGRLVASRWTREKAEEQTEEASVAKNIDHENHEDSSAESLDEEYNNYDSEDEEHKYDDDDESEESMEDFGVEDNDDSSSSYKSELDDEPDMSDITSNPSWLEKIQKTVQRIFEAVNFFQGPVDKSEAERVRKEYEESNAKLSKIQSRISSLTKKLKQDFGPEKEFYSFYGQCFESKQNKYVYKICPFKEASQTEGYSTTGLGNWEKFDDSYRAMQFSNGDRCWNGPDRSMRVKLRCGLKNEVSDVDEPSRCEYLALFSSPALCVEEKLKELKDKLDMMNKEQPQGHDEL